MLISKIQIVNEAYFGTAPELHACEILIKDILTNFSENKTQRVIDAAKITKSPMNKQLQEILKKFFGFRTMCINWDGAPDAEIQHAGKSIMMFASDTAPHLPVKSGNGKYYDKRHEYICVVNLPGSKFIEQGLSSDEILSIILHEIGYAFQCTPLCNILSVMDWVLVPVYFCYAFKKIKEAHYTKEAAQFIARIPGEWFRTEAIKLITFYILQMAVGVAFLSKGWNTFWHKIFEIYAPRSMIIEWKKINENILANIKDVKAMWDKHFGEVEKENKELEKDPNSFNYKGAARILWNVIDTVPLPGFGIWLPLMSLYDTNRDYSANVFADSFPTAYGYGPSYLRAIDKMEVHDYRTSKYYTKNNTWNVYNQYMDVMTKALQFAFRGDVQVQTTMMNQIKVLERDLEDPDIPAEMKAKIRSDLWKAKSIYKGYLEMDPDLKHLSAIINYRNFNDRYFNGQMDPRDFVNRVLNLGDKNSEV